MSQSSCSFCDAEILPPNRTIAVAVVSRANSKTVVECAECWRKHERLDPDTAAKSTAHGTRKHHGDVLAGASTTSSPSPEGAASPASKRISGEGDLFHDEAGT